MIYLTEPAAEHIKAFITKRGKGIGIRLGVKTNGCSGLAYKLEYADQSQPEDEVFTYFGVQVLIDPKSMPYLNGTQLDFAQQGLNKGFIFNNPNVKNECGCGESFHV